MRLYLVQMLEGNQGVLWERFTPDNSTEGRDVFKTVIANFTRHTRMTDMWIFRQVLHDEEVVIEARNPLEATDKFLQRIGIAHEASSIKSWDEIGLAQPYPQRQNWNRPSGM